MKLLLIDNFDSFVYNLAQAFGALGADPIVIRNVATIDELTSVEPDAVVISPGPGTPDDSGVCLEAVATFGRRVPVLGVCLGHQCIGQVFGATVERAPVGPVHGKTSMVDHDGRGVFGGLPDPFEATRYHSLALAPTTIPDELVVTAHSEDGTIMGVRHRELPIEGVQFHPESVLSFEGPNLLRNFLSGSAATTRA